MNSQELMRRFQAGQDQAATALFDRYVERLLALIRQRIGSKLRRRVDAEDVVQSAYRSFFVHARNEEYQFEKSGDLWRLLASVALNKLHGQIEKHTAAKRSIDFETPVSQAIAHWKTPEPSATEVVAVVEEWHLAVRNLSPEEWRVLKSRLQGQSFEEIGRLIGKSARTARRLFADSKQKIEQRLLTKEVPVPVKRRPAIEPHVSLQYADYVLEELLGSGGMGKVFRAREKHTGNFVAIKTLHKSRQSDERAVARFVQEAKILARLCHPGIVKVQGLGQFPSGGYFTVMDFVDGADLQTRLQQGPLSLSEVTRIIKEVAIAIEYAHDQGVVHCDLKPGNVLLDKKGRVYVTDFGFAFLVAGDLAANEKNLAGGTLGYIAPEILNGPNQPTVAADVYALGTLMWVLATNKLPGALDGARSADESLEGLHSICGRCLADDPNQRYRSLKEIIRELEKWQALT